MRADRLGTFPVVAHKQRVLRTGWPSSPFLTARRAEKALLNADRRRSPTCSSHRQLPSEAIRRHDHGRERLADVGTSVDPRDGSHGDESDHHPDGCAERSAAQSLRSDLGRRGSSTRGGLTRTTRAQENAASCRAVEPAGYAASSWSKCGRWMAQTPSAGLARQGSRPGIAILTEITDPTIGPRRRRLPPELRSRRPTRKSSSNANARARLRRPVRRARNSTGSRSCALWSHAASCRAIDRQASTRGPTRPPHRSFYSYGQRREDPRRRRAVLQGNGVSRRRPQRRRSSASAAPAASALKGRAAATPIEYEGAWPIAKFPAYAAGAASARRRDARHDALARPRSPLRTRLTSTRPTLKSKPR